MKQPLYLYGAGGLGREILSWIRLLDRWEPLGFLDDTLAAGDRVKGLPVMGNAEAAQHLPADSWYVVTIGNPTAKAIAVNKLMRFTQQFATLIHPRAIIQDPASVYIGPGTLVCAGCILTTDIHIGEHVLINLNATVGHDSRVGRCTSIMPGVQVSGEVEIGEQVLVGSGASIINKVSIGAESVVAMGSVVTKPVKSGVTVAGVPARPIL